MSVILTARLFHGISKATLKQVEELAQKRSCAAGAFVFRAGDRAEYLYLLDEGRVRLCAGEGGNIAYVISEPGDVFGWSSLMKHAEYTLSAQCVGPVRLLRIENHVLLHLLEKDPASGFLFFRHLSELIGQRLLNSYKATLSVHGERDAQSYG
jgi:CRP-like cAMP-binding protein